MHCESGSSIFMYNINFSRSNKNLRGTQHWETPTIVMDTLLFWIHSHYCPRAQMLVTCCSGLLQIKQYKTLTKGLFKSALTFSAYWITKWYRFVLFIPWGSSFEVSFFGYLVSVRVLGFNGRNWGRYPIHKNMNQNWFHCFSIQLLQIYGYKNYCCNFQENSNMILTNSS